jgi:hypothetical protein
MRIKHKWIFKIKCDGAFCVIFGLWLQSDTGSGIYQELRTNSDKKCYQQQCWWYTSANLCPFSPSSGLASSSLVGAMFNCSARGRESKCHAPQERNCRLQVLLLPICGLYLIYKKGQHRGAPWIEVLPLPGMKL